MSLDITEGTVPMIDEAPEMSDQKGSGWHDVNYPHSTPEAPYGFFPLTDGSPDYSRPRKRRPHGKRASTGDVSTSARSDRTAKTAAALLARMNTVVGLSLAAFGMPMAKDALLNANDTFEDMAYEALQTDPELAKKILSAGATSGKAQLGMAYVMLTGAIAPVAYMEIKVKREENEE